MRLRGFELYVLHRGRSRNSESQSWSKIYDQAAATITVPGDTLDNTVELIERYIFFLGATAVEDKSQEGVPETIHIC